MIHTVKGFGVVNRAEIDDFLELPLFFSDPANVGNLFMVPLAFLNPAWISGSSWFTYYWSLAWRILSITLLACEMAQLCSSLNILWHCLSWGLLWKLTFCSPVATAVFQICWHIEWSTFTASSFRIWKSSTEIPSPPLALFVVKLSKAHLTSHSRMSGSRSVITPSWLSWSWRSFLYSSSLYSCHLCF